MNVVVSHWSANVAVGAVYALVAAVHLAGMRGLAGDRGRTGAAGPDGRVAQAVLFHAGLLAALLALVSPVAYWSHRLVWVRSMQDLLLAVVAPALIVLGAPWLALRRGAGLRHARVPAGDPAGGLPGWDGGAAAAADGGRWPLPPVLAVVLFNLAWCGWHLPAAYDAGLAHPAVLAVEVVTYLGLGVLLWLQLIGSGPYTPALTPLRRVALLTATIVVGMVLGMVLVFSPGVLYPAYQGGHHAFSLVADQQVGGAVLWVLMLPAYIVAAVALVVGWLNDEEANALSAGLDRLLRPPKRAWPSRPGLR